jgi:hypothetical protein
MKPSRRAFLATAAALPAATAVLSAPAVAALPLEPATPVLTPYTEYPWRWMVSHDDYSFSEDFETLEKALEFARIEGAEVVAECKMQDFSLGMEGGDVLEALLGQNEDRIGEGEFLECTREQEKDLGAMVTAAIEAWAVKHRISLTAWSFEDIRNRQRVDAMPAAAG